jgi:murein DD-endopeptidase MepM/ murein hydrolase activator NlpD
LLSVFVRAAALSVLASVAACDVYEREDEGPPTPPPTTTVSSQTLPPHAAPVATATATETAGGKITIRPGQTLFAVSRDTNLPVRALIDANNLEPPYKLRIGQVLVIPNLRQYIVQSGDTLPLVARRYSVETSTLAKLNHLQPPFALAVGTKLVVPPEAEGTAVAAATPVPVTTSRFAPAEPVPTQPDPGAKFGATLLPPPVASPQAATQPAKPTTTTLPPPTLLEPVPVPPPPPNRTPTPPPADVAAASPPPTTAPPKSKPAPAPEPVTAPADEAPAAATAPPEPESGAPPPTNAVASAPAVAASVQNHRAPSAPLFYWPVRGKVLSTYGAAAGGTHNDGINIAAAAGTEVHAADSGTVAYADDKLRGFGNLLLIKHADGWVTAYAHNQELLVAKGDHVQRGQVIAKVGETGGVGRPQLHFEIRQRTTAVDPLDHLPQLGADGG